MSYSRVTPCRKISILHGDLPGCKLTLCIVLPWLSWHIFFSFLITFLFHVQFSLVPVCNNWPNIFFSFAIYFRFKSFQDCASVSRFNTFFQIWYQRFFFRFQLALSKQSFWLVQYRSFNSCHVNQNHSHSGSEVSWGVQICFGFYIVWQLY